MSRLSVRTKFKYRKGSYVVLKRIDSKDRVSEGIFEVTSFKPYLPARYNRTFATDWIMELAMLTGRVKGMLWGTYDETDFEVFRLANESDILAVKLGADIAAA